MIVGDPDRTLTSILEFCSWSRWYFPISPIGRNFTDGPIPFHTFRFLFWKPVEFLTFVILGPSDFVPGTIHSSGYIHILSTTTWWPRFRWPMRRFVLHSCSSLIYAFRYISFLWNAWYDHIHTVRSRTFHSAQIRFWAGMRHIPAIISSRSYISFVPLPLRSFTFIPHSSDTFYSTISCCCHFICHLTLRWNTFIHSFRPYILFHSSFIHVVLYILFISLFPRWTLQFDFSFVIFDSKYRSVVTFVDLSPSFSVVLRWWEYVHFIPLRCGGLFYSAISWVEFLWNFTLVSPFILHSPVIHFLSHTLGADFVSHPLCISRALRYHVPEFHGRPHLRSLGPWWPVGLTGEPGVSGLWVISFRVAQSFYHRHTDFSCRYSPLDHGPHPLISSHHLSFLPCVVPTLPPFLWLHCRVPSTFWKTIRYRPFVDIRRSLLRFVSTFSAFTDFTYRRSIHLFLRCISGVRFILPIDSTVDSATTLGDTFAIDLGNFRFTFTQSPRCILGRKSGWAWWMGLPRYRYSRWRFPRATVLFLPCLLPRPVSTHRWGGPTFLVTCIVL